MTTTTLPKSKRDEYDARIEAAHARLADAVMSLRTSSDWKQWLHQASVFHNYSFNNVMLIVSQYPQASQVAGAGTWKKLGRWIRKGEWEHPIWIFAPMLREYTAEEIAEDPKRSGQKKFIGWKTVRVYDVAQTDGRELAEHPDVTLLDGEAPEGAFDALVKIASAAGFRMAIESFPGSANGLTEYDTKTIRVKPNMSPAQTFKTGVHEIAHMRLHGPNGDRDCQPCREDAEVEAESVAFIVCDHNGVQSDSYSFGYVAGWSKRDAEAVMRAGANVTRTSKWIISEMNRIMKGTN
jgi:hypothetical protein